MHKKIQVLLIACFFLVGCATTSTVRSARGTGNTEIFNGSYDKVFDAAVGAVRDQAIEILEKDKSTGTILGKKGMGVVTYGERIGVYLYKVDDTHTRVEVISKKVLATTIFAKDWTGTIFESIHRNLEQSA